MLSGLQLIGRAIWFRVYFAASSVLITIVLSRLLGLEVFGRYAWLTSLAFLLSGLSQSGGSNLVVRETARSKGKQVPVLVLRRTGAISAVLLLGLAGCALLFVDNNVSQAVFLPIVILAFCNLALVLLCASTRGLGRIEAGQFPELVLRPSLFLLLIGVVVLLGHNFGAETLIYLLVSTYAIAGIVALKLLKGGLLLRPKIDNEKAEADWFGNFFRLGLIGWLAVGNAQLLIILTGAFSNFEEVGLYRVAAQAVLVMNLALTAIETVQAPAYARAYKDENHRRLHDLLQQSCRIGTAMSVTFAIFLLVLGEPLLLLFFGEDFVAAYRALCILVGAQLFNAVTGNVGTLMIAAKLEKLLLFGNLTALLVTLLAAWLFIPSYGALAAAGASALGLTMRNLINVWFCWRSLGILALPFASYSSKTIDGEVQ